MERQRVLVIDDDEIFNLMANFILRDVGITVNPQCFTNGPEALAYLDRHRTTHTDYLVFLDINMPMMSGWEILDHLEALPNRHHIHVIIVTSSIDRADREKAATFRQVVDYMVKPLNRELLATLKNHEKTAPFFLR